MADDPDQDANEARNLKTRADRLKWFKSLEVKGDFSPTTLAGYFKTVQGWLEDDMAFLRKPIPFWQGLSYWTRGLAFGAVAAGVLLPLPIFDTPQGLPTGLEMGYLSVLLGGLVLLLDRTFNISNSWMRLMLAEMQMKQVRYRLDLDWAKQYPVLTAENGATQGPVLIDLLRAAMDAGHHIMETQKTAWTTELSQAMDALRTRLDADRVTLEQLRTQRREGEQRPTTGAVNLTIDKPQLLKGPLTVTVGTADPVRSDTVPATLSVNNVPAGLQTISLAAGRASGSEPFAYSVTEPITAGQVKAITVAVQ